MPVTARRPRRVALVLSLLALGVIAGHAAAHAVPGADRGEAGHCVLCHASLASAAAPAPLLVPAATVRAGSVPVPVTAPARPALRLDARGPPAA